MEAQKGESKYWFPALDAGGWWRPLPRRFAALKETRRLSGPQGRSGRAWGKGNFLPPPWFKPRNTLSVASLCTDCVIAASFWSKWHSSVWATRRFMLCTPHQISLAWSNQEDWDGQDMWHVWRRGEVLQGFDGDTWVRETTLMTQV